MTHQHSSDLPTYLPTYLPTEIARRSINTLTADQFKQHYQDPGIPVLLTDGLTFGVSWDLNYLCDKLGTQEFVVRFYGQARYQQDKRTWTTIGSGVSPQTKPFAEYADLLRSKEAHRQDIYLAKCPIQNTPLATIDDVQILQTQLTHLGFQHPASSLNLWVGPGGHVECLHYDPTDGTLIQLHGCKRVLLFPPEQIANLYPYPFYTHLRYGMRLRCWFSQVYPDRPDFEAFPRLRQALQHKYEIVLNPGEALYIPAGWWHEVESLGDDMVCSINRFWRVPARRAIWSWLRWRAHLGSLLALPNVLISLVKAVFSPKRQQKLKELLQLF